MTVEELEAKIRVLENQVRTLQDIEEIKKLQRAFGFYLEHWMAEDIIDLFADGPDSTLSIAAGQFRGKENIARLCRRGNPDGEFRKDARPEYLHQVMQLSGVVDVDPDGRTARGRWYGFGANALPAEGGVVPGWMNGVYENEYVKESGKWKFKKVRWCMTFNAPYTESWVEPTRRVSKKPESPYRTTSGFAPDGPPEETLYPSGFVCPFHYKNPVTGKNHLPG
jgi:hypothetical protein